MAFSRQSFSRHRSGQPLQNSSTPAKLSCPAGRYPRANSGIQSCTPVLPGPWLCSPGIRVQGQNYSFHGNIINPATSSTRQHPHPKASSPVSNRFQGKIKFPGPCSRNKDIFLPRQLIHGSGSPAGAGFPNPGSLINHSHGLSSHHLSRSGLNCPPPQKQPVYPAGPLYLTWSSSRPALRCRN